MARTVVLPVLLAFVFLSAADPVRRAQGLDLCLPTPNDSLFHRGGPAFYQFVERSFQGRHSRPWEAGQYGYVRNPLATRTGVLYTRLHEGIDIRPTRRDIRGEPLDPVFAVDGGKVVHTNVRAADSNYGRYVVIEHIWGGAPYYSLYAHLGSVRVAPGERVVRGRQIATMGHTGAGATREGAHLHFEINLLLHSRFESWHRRHFPAEPNHHGIYNGLNLLGLDPARILVESRRNLVLDIPTLLKCEEPFFRVRIPHSPRFELVRRYPWLNAAPGCAAPLSWELSFNRAGVPLRAAPSTAPAAAPALLWIRRSSDAYETITRDLIAGRGAQAQFTRTGRRFLELLAVP